jgi:cell division protein FtsQ
MKRPLRLQLEAKKNRLKRHAGDFLREIGRVILLTGAIVVVTAALLIAYDGTIRSPYLFVREIFVKGCKELTEKEILALAAIRPAPNILTLNPDAIARRIQVNPWIREVSVGREFPDRLVIVVRERKAVALLQGDGELHLLDGDGSLFKKLEPGDDTNLPVLTGCVREGKPDEALIKQSIALLGTLAGAKEFPAIGSVSEVHGNETFGLSVFTDTGLCLQLGFDGYENKLQRLAPVMADLDRKNLKTGFLLIDLSDPAKINVQQRSVLAPGGSAGSAGTGTGYRM